MDEDARLMELDYTRLKALQFVTGLQDASPRQARFRMLHRLDMQSKELPLTIEDLVAECENITALKMDSTYMEKSEVKGERCCQTTPLRSPLLIVRGSMPPHDQKIKVLGSLGHPHENVPVEIHCFS
ncbi:hypothetical protein OESDEN_07906 [Oesophagostomum dentatum]|uniref:Uncharacterized protein n=1 Tax=Oesophagostomum dentatum TaxID=61180 RepID=A0A0B1TA27_OESDE|nr:hypothetical protein OESDEN_07906 [Oesophagostomum dentatum]